MQSFEIRVFSQSFEGVYQANIKCQCSSRPRASMDNQRKIVIRGSLSTSGLSANRTVPGNACGNNHGFTIIDHVCAKGGVTRCLLGIYLPIQDLNHCLFSSTKLINAIGTSNRGRSDTRDAVEFFPPAQCPGCLRSRKDTMRRSSSSGIAALIQRHSVLSTHARIFVRA